ncbi:MAG: hypothetical protein WBS20_14450 [Lysobacterales bacterium]
MKSLTLADVLAGPQLQFSDLQLFNTEDIENTAALASAESVDKTNKLLDSLVSKAKDQILDIPLLDIMLGGWIKLRKIQAYATDEKLQSGATYKHTLSEHKVASNHSPRIELLVFDKKVTEVTIDIELALVLARVNLMITKGRIMEVRISGCKAKASLSCRKHKILEKESEDIDFPASIKLGNGIAIPPPLNFKGLVKNY